MVTGLLALASTRRAAATSARDDEAADNLGKSLASLFLLKEENVPAAKQSMNVFQVQCQSQANIVHAHEEPLCGAVSWPIPKSHSRRVIARRVRAAHPK